jgi:hypothetical protein
LTSIYLEELTLRIFARNYITSGISALRRLKEFADKQTLLSVYNAIVRPYFDYGMCLEKRNKKDSKNYKTELLGLL